MRWRYDTIKTTKEGMSVESMARVTKEVFGLHRWLKHEAAANELMVRWNGPDATNDNDPMDYVQQRHRLTSVAAR